MEAISQPANQSESGPGQTRSVGDVGSMSGLSESAHRCAAGVKIDRYESRLYSYSPNLTESESRG